MARAERSPQRNDSMYRETGNCFPAFYARKTKVLCSVLIDEQLFADAGETG